MAPGRSQVLQPEDDPLSEAFVPLTDRSEGDKARWWAKSANGRHSRPPQGVMD